MGLADTCDQFFAYEDRLGSFQAAQPVSKRRVSTAHKTAKSLKWPHKFLSIEELAKAGFFFYPTQANPDNVACFLCHKSMDGWEEGDDPLAEHLKHSPDCGWAIVATIERQEAKGGELREEYPLSARMIDARKATFADKWPHENKKGWKCKVKQLVDAGWKYVPTPEYDDMVTCTYCELALDGWDPVDKPLDEHFKRSPDCAFFSLISNNKPAPKRANSKKGRASKASRLSTQSAFTVASEGQSLLDPAEEGDSVLTTATTATQTGKKMGKAKKATAAKGKKSKTKKAEPVEVEEAPEPEDADFEVKVEAEAKQTRGKKRNSDAMADSTHEEAQIEAPPPPKRRATRTRGSMAVNDSVIQDAVPVEAIKPKGRKGRASTKSTRKTSTASVATINAAIPNDDEIDKALEADLERQLSDDEKPVPPSKRTGRASKAPKPDHTMFDIEPMEIDEAALEAELETMEMESKTLPKAKGAKSKQTRKPSAKQQAAARKAAEKAAAEEAEAAAEAQADDPSEDVSMQIITELEQSISIQQSSPLIQPKKQRAQSKSQSKATASRATRASAQPYSEKNLDMSEVFEDAIDHQNDDSGNETDASIASQSTVIRGGASRRGSNMKKGMKAASRNIEEVVHKPVEVTTTPEDHETPAVPEVEPEVVPMKTKSKGKAAKTAARPQIQQTLTAMVENMERDAETPVSATKHATFKSPSPVARSPTPAPKERTPSQSPQSSDAENHPPSSKPSTKAKTATPHSAATQKTSTPFRAATRVPLASTPIVSPSKRNVISGLQSAQPWSAVDLDTIFMKSPGYENGMPPFGEAIPHGALTSPEKKMTVEEWILYNANVAEEKLRRECEGMVGIFEREGGRAMRALEGIECIE